MQRKSNSMQSRRGFLRRGEIRTVMGDLNVRVGSDNTLLNRHQWSGYTAEACTSSIDRPKKYRRRKKSISAKTMKLIQIAHCAKERRMRPICTLHSVAGALSTGKSS